MPGDALLPRAVGVWTHAITIRRPPADIWPWLAQLGAGRAGWYSYDFLDNAGEPSAKAILPDEQAVSPGDIFPAVPGARDAFEVVLVEPPRSLVLRAPAGGDPPIVSWALVLVPLEEGNTRLLTRARASAGWKDAARTSSSPGGVLPVNRIYRALARLPMPALLLAAGFGHWWMESKMLRGIRSRAEHDHSRGDQRGEPTPGS
jgi:hypothetical protein